LDKNCCAEGKRRPAAHLVQGYFFLFRQQYFLILYPLIPCIAALLGLHPQSQRQNFPIFSSKKEINFFVTNKSLKTTPPQAAGVFRAKANYFLRGSRGEFTR